MVTQTTSTDALRELLIKYGVDAYRVEPHYGNSLNYGPLKKLIVYDRVILDQSEFNAIGYGVVCRNME